MKVLIAGAGGQVGQALLAGAPAAIEAIGCSRHELDIADPLSARRALERVAPAVVVNAAGYTAVDRAEAEPEQAFRANGSGVADLAAICAERGIRLVQLSTDFVFDGSSSRPYRTDDPPGPLSVYGKSKLAGETAALSDPRNLVIRTAWVYSVSGTNFVNTMLRLMRERDELPVIADQIGTPTHARSLAGAVWRLVDGGATGLHHFTDAGVASWYDFAVAIQEEAIALGLLDRAAKIVPIATANYPTPATRPAYSVLDKAGTWRLVGAPARHWRAELRDMLSALKEPHE